MIVNIQDDILRLHALGLLDRLLRDKATKGNILWATEAYARFGDWYSPGNELRSPRITGENSDLIKTRARRALEQRTERTRQHGEVFTPLWIVKKMNEVADAEWFRRKSGFSLTDGAGRVRFTKAKTWKKYVDARRLEIACGEAPFLVTRYDVETGEALPIEERIGLLDRKLRVVSENAADIDEWKAWALRAVQAIYGYELQGDNLLIARVNILCSVEEHMVHRWRQKPERAWLEKLCNVICWNLWQMDGIKGCVPAEPQPTEEQLCLFPPEPQSGSENLFGEKEEREIGCRLFDWRRGGNGRSISYKALREKGPELMKFDFIIGNPPYQDETLGENKGFAPPIYHLFMDGAYEIGEKVELIHPARFLFNAGSTPKAWNQKMLADSHFSVLCYEQDASIVFPNTDIKGGIVISYHDKQHTHEPIGIFTKYTKLNTIIKKAKPLNAQNSIMQIIFIQNRFNLPALYEDHPECKASIGSDGRDSRFEKNIFVKIPLFSETNQNNEIKVMGIYYNKRAWRYIPKKYVDFNHENLSNYKVVLPVANGSGEFGQPLSSPFVEKPFEAYTRSFIGIGSFDTEKEAEAALKYIKTKFARAMLSILKVTQMCNKDVWAFVPLQDFSPTSDIDWSRPIPEIDRQLYAKYGLDDAEIEFIETHVKEMS